ncbi:MAG: phage tail tape measure protein [Chloroflexi bacterium]|nr:phage tail tape measure protein [Chloroflexota bacterium]
MANDDLGTAKIKVEVDTSDIDAGFDRAKKEAAHGAEQAGDAAQHAWDSSFRKLKSIASDALDAINKDFEQVDFNALESELDDLEASFNGVVPPALDAAIHSLRDSLSDLEADTGQSDTAIDNFRSSLETLERTITDVNKDIEKGLGKSLDGMDNELNAGLEQSLANTDDIAAEAGEASGSAFRDQLMVGITAVAALVATALAGIGVASFDLASQVDQATRDIQASFGLTREEAQHLSDVAVDIFGANFGENFDDVKQALIAVRQQMRGLADDDLQSVTQNAIMVRDVFGIDVAESAAAANVLMTQFGLSSDQAFDFIVAGNQRGLNASGDFLESIQEYAPQLAAGGASASQFFSLLDSGFVNGVLGTDKAADAFKEFRIRITEASDEGAAALNDLGINADDFYAGMATGNITAADGFSLVLASLNQISDPIERNRIGVQLLGTQWEDLGPQVASSLSLTGTSMEDLAGATDSLAVKYESLGMLFQGVWRQVQVDILKPIGDELLAIANTIIPVVSAAISGLGSLLAGEMSFEELATAAYEWGVGIVDQLSAGIIDAASSLIDSLSVIGDTIAYWLQPNSPPKIAPNLDQWGADAATVYMDGWAEGDYSAFNTLSNTIRQQLESMASLGTLPKDGVIPALFGSRAAIADIISSLQTTGDVSEDLFKVLREASPAGESAERLARAFVAVEQASRDVAEAQADLEQATAAVAEAQAELNELTSEYEDQLNPLRDQLDETERQLKALEDAKKAAKLQAIVDSAEASEEEKAIARLELQKLNLEQMIDVKEREKDVAVDAAQAKIDAAKADEDAAQATLATAQAALQAEQERMQATQSALAVQRENNQLVAQQVSILEQLARQQEQATKASGGMAGSARAAAGGLRGLGQSSTDVGAALGHLVGQSTAAATTIDTGLLPTLTNAGANIASAFGAIPEVATSFLAELAPLASELGQWILDAIPLVAAALGKVWQIVVGFIMDNLPTWIATLAQMALALVSWVLDALPVLITNLGNVFTGMITWVLDSVPKWASNLLQLGNQLWQWVVDALPTLGTQLGNVLNALITWIGDTITAVGPRLIELAWAFVSWIVTDVLPALPGKLAEILYALGTFLGNVLIEIVPKLAELGQAFLSWIGDTVLPTIGSKLGEIWDAISTWIGDTAQKALDAAKAIGQNIADGISGAISKGLNGLRSFVAKIINPIIDGINLVIDGMNLVGGNVARIPKLAKGTSYWSGDSAIVSEVGLEWANLPGIGEGLLMPGIYDLPRGSQVFNADTTAAMFQPQASGTTINQYFDAGITAEGIRRVAQQEVTSALTKVGVSASIRQLTRR